MGEWREKRRKRWEWKKECMCNTKKETESEHALLAVACRGVMG